MSINKTSSKNTISLDLSNHNLNNSSSKQKFSFPKASRFDSSRFLYFFHHADAIRFIKCQALETGGQHPSVMEIRIWELGIIRMLLNLQPIKFKVSLELPKRAHYLGLEDRYLFIKLGNVDWRAPRLVNG